MKINDISKSDKKTKTQEWYFFLEMSDKKKEMFATFHACKPDQKLVKSSMTISCVNPMTDFCSLITDIIGV